VQELVHGEHVRLAPIPVADLVRVEGDARLVVVARAPRRRLRPLVVVLVVVALGRPFDG
jgi:hypothetical protein